MNTELGYQQALTAASLVHHLVADLLNQRQFEFVEFPEIVELAVIGTGLGSLRSQMRFVQSSGLFWDSTYWHATPRPFLDVPGWAYASALAAWVRGQSSPEWMEAWPGELKRPIKKSLKYLVKTEDSFFHPSTAGEPLLQRPQSHWIQWAADRSVSRQVIAMRQLEFDSQVSDEIQSVLHDNLRENNRTVVLHTIAAVERLPAVNDSVATELRWLVEKNDDEIRAKAIIAVTKLGLLDDATITRAAEMLDAPVRFVVFAGLVAIASMESVAPMVVAAADRGLIRALQTCDYEFVGLYAAAFRRWVSDPREHFQRLLQDDHSEYLEIAVEALENLDKDEAQA